MADHLPECYNSRPQQFAKPCICDRLRACEQRVLLSKPNIELSAVYGYEAGRADGLTAARDAVAALPHDAYCVSRDARYSRPCNCPHDDALAAIDALRGES